MMMMMMIVSDAGDPQTLNVLVTYCLHHAVCRCRVCLSLLGTVFPCVIA
jgi:hypothetical protein